MYQGGMFSGQMIKWVPIRMAWLKHQASVYRLSISGPEAYCWDWGSQGSDFSSSEYAFMLTD